MIQSGLASVRIGTAPVYLNADQTLALAMIELRNSEFAKTQEGKAVLARLEELYAAGRIKTKYLDRDNEEAGHYDPDSDTIWFNLVDENDPNKVACTLVHEGTHANGYNDHTLDGEERCFKNELDYYNRSKHRTGYDNKAMNGWDESRRNGTLREDLCATYKELGHPLDGCPQ
jgi:hypothetical protein